MHQAGATIEIESVSLQQIAEALSHTQPFAGISMESLSGVESADRIRAKAGSVLAEARQPFRFYWVVLEGEIRADRPETDGSSTPIAVARTGEGFGEGPLLSGKSYSPYTILASEDSTVVRFGDDAFWALLACCPSARKVVLENMAQRLQSYQVEALHREKLISLGTLAAGLMHELHNPGSAAKRAASQLRQNLLRLQQLSLRFSDKPKTQPQLECMRMLLEHTMNGCSGPAMSSLEQSDAEESMADWLASAGVENAFGIAPALVGIGLQQQELVCAKAEFDTPSFSDALNWLEALVSSVTLVCTIEEGISRVSDLVMAVKKFAYDDRSTSKILDVHESLQSTLTILGHKLRLKGVSVEKRFSAMPASIQTRGSSLSQVWTNLIDNAVDASPEGSQIKIVTWTEPNPKAETAEPGSGEPGWLAVAIEDHGNGIPPEVLPRIFEAFFTTKPQGSGTGLGLEIVHRIVTQKLGGTIEVSSQPGKTQFIVRLPLAEPAGAACPVLPSA